MSKRKKRLERIRQNPKNVSFEDLQKLLEDYGFTLERDPVGVIVLSKRKSKVNMSYL